MSANYPQRTRNAAQIEADLAATRDRLTASVQALIDQVHPNRIKQRQIDNVKRLANAELENAKSLIFNARGDLRTDRVAALAGRSADFGRQLGAVGSQQVRAGVAAEGRADVRADECLGHVTSLVSIDP